MKHTVCLLLWLMSYTHHSTIMRYYDQKLQHFAACLDFADLFSIRVQHYEAASVKNNNKMKEISPRDKDHFSFPDTLRVHRTGSCSHGHSTKQNSRPYRIQHFTHPRGTGKIESNRNSNTCRNDNNTK